MALALLSALGHGESGQPGAFLRQDAGARSAALAGAVEASVDDPTALATNPSRLSRLVKPEVSATHVVLFEDTAHDLVAAGLATRWGGVALGYTRQSSGGFERRATPNDAASSFSIGQTAFSGGWGVRVPGWPVDLGTAVRSVKESIGGVSASGVAVDLGAAVGPWRGFSVGALAQNAVAPELTFVTRPVQYPRRLSLSPSYERGLSDDWRARASLRFARLEGEGLEPSGGVELLYRRLAAVRLGLRAAGPSFGAGIRLGNTTVDYAVVLHDLGLGHLVTLSQRFGQTREEIEETIRRGISRLTRHDAGRLAKAYIQKAEDDLKADRMAEALRSYEAAALLTPDDFTIPERVREISERWDASVRRQMVERTAAQARDLRQQGSLLASRQYWRSVLELEGDHTEARAALSEIESMLSQEERTRLDDARRAQQDAEVGQRLAVIETLLGRRALRQARAESLEVARRYPDEARVKELPARLKRESEAFAAERLSAAEAEAVQGRDAEGLKILDAALRELPGHAKLAEKAASLRAGLQKTVSAENRKKAEQLYYRAVEQYLKGNYQAAGELASEVLKLDPSSAAVKTLREKLEAAQRSGR